MRDRLHELTAKAPDMVQSQRTSRTSIEQRQADFSQQQPLLKLQQLTNSNKTLVEPSPASHDFSILKEVFILVANFVRLTPYHHYSSPSNHA
jgi:hypothetical protein